ncbi:MAG: hypothetical protein ACK5U7_11835 [Bacteroidota bacterium]|jgi:hypothetical protein
MALNETSFKPGERRGGRTKGAKNKRTQLREAVGAGSWEQIETYLTGEGAARLIESMRELRPGQFVYAYAGLLEYFRPKLSRQAITGEGETEITVTMNLNK